MSSVKFKGKQNLMKELQRTISLRVYNDVFMSGQKKSGQVLNDLLFQKYHGQGRGATIDSNNLLGYASQMATASGMFAPLFRQVANVGQGKSTYYLQEKFHCQYGKLIPISEDPKDGGINETILTITRPSNRRLLKGRTIWEASQLALQNGRKALAIVQRSKFKDFEHRLSGKEYEEYLLFLRREMYFLLRKEKQNTAPQDTLDENGDNDDDDDVAIQNERDDEMPSDYIWPGFLAFAVWGPIIPTNMTEDCKAAVYWTDNTADGKPAAKDNGRSAFQVEIGTEFRSNNASQEADQKNKFSKELSSKQLYAASIAQQQIYLKEKRAREHFNDKHFYWLRKIGNADKQLGLYMPMVKPERLADPNAYPNDYIVGKIMEAERQKKEAEDKITVLMEDFEEEQARQIRTSYERYVDLTLASIVEQPCAKKAKKSPPSSLSDVDACSPSQASCNYG